MKNCAEQIIIKNNINNHIIVYITQMNLNVCAK